jgi:hypothetical protein
MTLGKCNDPPPSAGQGFAGGPYKLPDQDWNMLSKTATRIPSGPRRFGTGMDYYYLIG